MRKSRFQPNVEADLEPKGQENGSAAVLPTEQYSFPEHGITVEAHSQSEAIDKLRAIIGGEVK